MKEKTRYLLGAAMLLVSAVLIVAGINNKEINMVLTKAVNICLACIGIA